MFDDFFERPHRRHVKDLNLVPVIDMFSTVVFFLLLSTTFLAYTKLTLPPAQVDVISKPLPTPPLSPHVFIGSVGSEGEMKLLLSWEGKQPGELTETADISDPVKAPDSIRKQAGSLITQFLTKFPGEKSIRLTMTRDTSYQYMVSAMDGIRDQIQDVVLTSYEEADSKLASSRSGTRRAASAAPGGG